MGGAREEQRNSFSRAFAFTLLVAPRRNFDGDKVPSALFTCPGVT